MDQLKERRSYTKDRIDKLQTCLGKASDLLGGKACVYATGSFGRLEVSSHSDLDLFIVGKTSEDGSPNQRKRLLTFLDEICVKADLILATRILNFPEFDGDGKYLAYYDADDLINSIGTPEDDAENTLTGRLLLFLESQPLLGSAAYNIIIEDVVAAYWRDYEGHEENFKPAFLTNDILRLWRTFCVNYEARTARTPIDKKIKGKIKNYKLKHSRMLTCYSALLYLLSIYIECKSVSPQNAIKMTALTPAERLQWLKDRHKSSSNKIQELIDQYDKFLETTYHGDSNLIGIFSDPQRAADYMKESYKFGDLMFETLYAIGNGNQFFRLIVV